MTSRSVLARLGWRLMLVAALCGCASFPTMQVGQVAPGGGGGEPADTGPSAGVARDPRAAIQIPAPGRGQARPAVPEASPDEIAALVPDEPIGASLPSQPLPQFLNTAFTEVLRVPFALGPGIGARTEVITVNAPPTLSKRNYVRLLQTALRSYGLSMSIRGNAIVINEDAAGAGSTSIQVIRSRSSADTPAAARSVIQFFQLVALQADAVQELVRSMVGQGVNITTDSVSNALVLQGNGRAVVQAVEILRNLDQPAFAGAQVVRLEPVFWSAVDFAGALQTTLQAEGYVVSTDPLGSKSILILPLVSTNQTLVFAADNTTMERVRYWARELDQPNAIGDRNSTFVYEVRNTGASAIGQMVINAGSMQPAAQVQAGIVGAIQGAIGQAGGQAIQGGRGGQNQGQQFGGGGRGAQQLQQQFQAGRGGAGRGGAQNAQQLAGRGGAGQTQVFGGAVPGGGAITVDDAGNRILFTGTATEFAQLRSLLRQLDTPAREVLVEATVAEVTLTDETRVGLQFFFENQAGSGGVYSGGTLPGTVLPAGVAPNAVTPAFAGTGLNLNTGGFTVGFNNGPDLRAAFNAFASNNKVNVLSQPRLTARSGTAAQIQVGADVPFIQQRQTPTGGAANDVIQTVSYRQTGVILQITPVIYGDNRVDLQIYQEVSDDEDNSNPTIASPIFNTRSITTTLSLQDGATAVLGGLMEDSFSKGNRGIPFLKDIPILGQAFRTDTISGRKTALVVLLTPFIIRDEDDMTALARQMTDEINNAFRIGRGGSYTLTPFAAGVSLGVDPPNPRPRDGLSRPAEKAPAP